MVQVSVVTETAELAALESEWSRLEARSDVATIFSTFDWIRTWWEVFGSAQFTVRLHIITVRDQANELIGIAPLTARLSPFASFIKLSFLGRPTSDYHDFLVAQGFEQQVCEAIFSHVIALPGYPILDLDQVRENSIIANFMRSGINDFTTVKIKLEGCTNLALPDTGSGEQRWPAFLARQSKKFRSNIRYYDRSLDQLYQVERSVAETEDDVVEGINALFSLHQRRWNRRWLPGVFFNKKVRTFHEKLSLRMRDRGRLRLHLLKLDGTIEAALYCFSFNRVTSYYQSGFEPSLRKRSLGTVLTALAVKKACEDENVVFDFLRGEEPYKQHWTRGALQHNQRFILTNRPGWLFQVYVRLVRTRVRVELWVKQQLRRR